MSRRAYRNVQNYVYNLRIVPRGTCYWHIKNLGEY